MKQLYLPTTGRRAGGTHRILHNTVQDNVRIDPDSIQYAITNAIVTEFEHAMALVRKLDSRPWTADTQTPGALVYAESELDETTLDQLLFGPPKLWEPALVDTFLYTPSTSIGMINQSAGVIGTATEIDRAVVFNSSLICQVGSLLYRLEEFDTYGSLVDPTEEGVLGANGERFSLVSLNEHRYALFAGEIAQTIDVNVQIQGLDLVVGDTGCYTITINYLALADVASSDDLSLLVDFKEPLHLYDDNNEQTPYTVSNNVITIASGTGPYRLFYNAEHVINFTSPVPALNDPIYNKDTFFISFAAVAENMYRMIDKVSAVQNVDTLMYVPGLIGRIPIDAQGFVGRVNVGHTISYVLPTKHHIIVAGDNTVSLVEYDNETLLLQQSFGDLDICGLTWTKDGEAGLVVATNSGFDIYALRDVRTERSGNWKVYN